MKNILIVDGNINLREQLVRLAELAKLVVPDWQILQADNYDNAREYIRNYEINILVCDLFLPSNDSDIINQSYIPGCIQLAQELRNTKTPFPAFIIVLSSNLDSSISNYQHLNYKETGVNIFLNRSVTPYSKFIKIFKKQLQSVVIAPESIPIFPQNNGAPESRHERNGEEENTIGVGREGGGNNFVPEIENHISDQQHNNIQPWCSYWTLIYDSSDLSNLDLHVNIINWQKNFSVPEACFVHVEPNGKENFYLKKNGVITNIDKYPILLISESSLIDQSTEIPESIKIGSRTLKIILDNNILTYFLDLIHARLRNNGVCDIRKQMESPEDWDWLNDNTIGFSHEKGEIELVTDLYENRLPKINTDNNNSVIFNKKKDFNPATRKIQNFLKELEETTLALIEAIEERVIEIPSSPNMGKTEQHTRIKFPAECIVKAPIKLVIQIPQQSHSEENKLEPAILYIQLTAENFSAEQKRQRLIVPVNEKSEEIIFELTPTEVGEQMVEIEFFHKGARVGYAIAKTNVKSQAT